MFDSREYVINGDENWGDFWKEKEKERGTHSF